MLKRLICLLTAMLLAAPAAAKASQSLLDDAMNELFTRYKAKGGVVVVGKGGDIVYQYAYGSARRSPETPVTMETQFRVASVSKLVTAIGVMQLVEQGALALDEDISVYFGETLRNPGFRATPITLRMLMTHTAGLNPDGDYKKGADSVTNMLSLKKRRTRNYMKFRPGTRYSYSNFNGGLLGSLVEAATGQHVSTYMQQHVFAPLGAEGAYAVAALSDPARAAETYNENGTIHDHVKKLAQNSFVDEADPQHHYNMTTGSLWISGPDLCRIGMMLCSRGELNGVRILQRDTVLLMEEDQQGQGGVTCASPYGLNVNRVENLVDGVMIYGHQGMSGAALANLYYEPEQQLTFVLITNGCETTLLDYITRFSRNAFNACWEAFYTDVLPETAFVVVEDE